MRGAIFGVGVAAVAGGVLFFGAQQYQAQAKVAGPGPTRWHSSSPTVRLLVEHPANLRDVEVTIDGVNLSTYATVDKHGIVLRGVTMHDGWHHVRMQAQDKNWFGGRVDGKFGILVDTKKPRLLVDTKSGYTTSTKIAGKVEKGARLTVSWKGGRISQVATSKTFSFSPKLPEGQTIVRISARDLVGNRSQRWVKLTVDRTKPIVDTTGVPALQRADAPKLTGAIEDATPVKVVARFDEQSARLQLAGGGNGKWALPLPHIAEGLHVLRLQVTDSAGNVTTIQRKFTVDSTEKLSDDETLQFGARGQDVVQLEKRLRGEGFWHGSTTRFYNQRVVAAVKAFEKDRAMVQDGIAGPAVIASTSGRLVVKLSEHRVYFMREGKVVFSAPIAIGRPGFETPLGHWAITSKIENPTWVPPNSPWAAGLEPIPPGSSNPLGSRWIGTSAPNVGFHATNEPSSVGRSASHGCMRMYDADVKRLFSLVKVGMPVDIQP
jgi:lipoprotein-anchoring transpeptidase ErfK/SrfK